MPDNLDISQIIQRLPGLSLKPEPPDNKADQRKTKPIAQHLIHAAPPL
jgi:hypothetical protein